MRPNSSEIQNSPATAPPVQQRARTPVRLGIGSRLALGLAVVAAVIAIGHGLATETTRQAVQSLRRMQIEHEPRARRAAMVMETLAAYDRAVIEYLHGDRQADFESITAAAEELDRSVNHYFNDAPAPLITAPEVQLRIEIARHIAQGEKLASLAAKRTQWLERRRDLLNGLQHRVASAGTGMACDRRRTDRIAALTFGSRHRVDCDSRQLRRARGTRESRKGVQCRARASQRGARALARKSLA